MGQKLPDGKRPYCGHPALMLNSSMKTASLKLSYAVITLSVATWVYVIGEHGGDPTWLTQAYFIATIVFATLIVGLTFKAVNPKASRDKRYFGTFSSLMSFQALMPPVFFIWGVVQGDPRYALLAFSLSAGVSAGFYLLIQAFHLVWPSRWGTR